MKYTEIKLVVQYAEQRIDIEQVKTDIEAALSLQSGYLVLDITDSPMALYACEMEVGRQYDTSLE
ncbi:hypothetical protein LCGC14_2673220 [marine sediment metagenome]|uniref:Uncharacterized protein n=1 Tax=marine sediment metagenome TaxID=412755 RepID=A0A0F8ZNI4_9ZZZZ